MANYREPCPKHPSLPREFCSCQNPRGTDRRPVFTLVEGHFSGLPVVEIFKNGGPIHRYDQHFQFGMRKAEMMLICVDALHEFAWASPEERRNFAPRVVQEGSQSIRVSVEFFPSFTWSTGDVIHEPWLRLESLDHGHVVKGLGVMKSRAVWALREEIGEWLARNTSVH